MQILGNIFNAIIFCICYWRYILCFISFYQSHSALYAAAMVSALRYDPFLRSIPFTGCVSHITRNTGMVKWDFILPVGYGCVGAVFFSSMIRYAL